MKHKLRAGQRSSNKPRAVVLACFFLSLPSLLKSQESVPRMAIVGDSISVAAVTREGLSYDAERLWEILRGKQTWPPASYAPVRLWPGPREFRGSFEWLGLNLVAAMGIIYFDAPENSWGARLAQTVGLGAADVVIGAQDGARMKDAAAQLARIHGFTKGAMPKNVFLFFTGNDLCAPTLDLVSSRREFETRLKEALNYLAVNFVTPESGANVFVMNYLSVLQLATRPQILQKKILAHGETLTCSEMIQRKEGYAMSPAFIKDHPEAAYVFKFLPPSQAAMCPTVFNQNLDFKSDNQVLLLANRISAYREAAQQSVDTMNRKVHSQGSRLSFHYLSAPSRLLFEAHHIAADCFHLSKDGQDYLATEVLKDLNALNISL